jgi:uncharacterized protein
MDQERKDISRRKFLAGAAALSSAPIIASCSGDGKMPLSSNVNTIPNAPSGRRQAGTMPKRTFGKTGLSVSILGFGCGSNFSVLSDPAGRFAALDAAVAGGINYFDCASEYGTAATLGNYFSAASAPIARDQVFIVTKLNNRTNTGAQSEFQSELTKLKTTYVDVLLMHALPSTLDLAAINAAAGAWTFLKAAKAAGTARFIGFSSMDNTAAAAGGVLANFITDLNPDVVTPAMQVSGYSNFRTALLPVANAANCGVACIKTIAGISATNTIDKVLGTLWNFKDVNGKFALSTLIVGHHDGATQVDTNVAVAKAYGDNVGVLSFDTKEVEREADRCAPPGSLAWQQPDFKDNGKPYIWS